jgi:hypothetical protein
MNKKTVLVFLLLCLVPIFLISQILSFYVIGHRLSSNIKDYANQWAEQNQVEKEVVSNIQNDLQKIEKKINKIDLKVLKPIQDLSKAAVILSQNQHRYIVMLQNSDELRATGGFFGSYFILDINQGQLAKLQIKDIYVIDGQFLGFKDAPRGLDEYLSSGKGLRLPDSNWWADFPTSAQTILAFFSEIEQIHYDGVIAINLPLLEKLLEVTEAIYLPDYRTHVDANNFAQLARADRSDFFPGSQEKANFLNHFFKHLQFKVIETVQEKPQALIELFKLAIREKDLQIYSNKHELQELIQANHLSGQLHNPTLGRFYAPVESNVGINKANRQIERQFSLTINQDIDQFKITYQNHFDQHYINYQRLYLPANSKVLKISIDQKESQFHQQIVQNSLGEEFLEIGFLVSVLSQQSSEVAFEVQHDQLANPQLVYLRHQAGAPASQFELINQDKKSSFSFAADQIVDLSLLE